MATAEVKVRVTCRTCKIELEVPTSSKDFYRCSKCRTINGRPDSARGFVRGVLCCGVCAYKQSKIVNTFAGTLLLSLVGVCLAWALPIVTQGWGRSAHALMVVVSLGVGALAVHDFFSAVLRSPGRIPRRTPDAWHTALRSAGGVGGASVGLSAARRRPTCCPRAPTSCRGRAPPNYSCGRTTARLRRVQVMDHHRAFIDNCVGAGNQKSFVFVLTIGGDRVRGARAVLPAQPVRGGPARHLPLAKELQAVERARFAEAKLASAAEGKPLKEIVKARKLARLPALRALRLIRQSQDIKMIMLMVLLTGVSLGVFVLFCNQAVQLKNGETQLEKFDREGRAGADWRSFPGWRGVLRMEHGPRTGGPKRPADTHNHAD